MKNLISVEESLSKDNEVKSSDFKIVTLPNFINLTQETLDKRLSSLSTRILYVDVAEIDTFSSEFIYNFYHYNNEKDNEIITTKQFIKDDLKKNPRYVKLTFNTNFNLNNNNTFIKNNFLTISGSLVNNENKLENNSYFSFKLNDKTINEKLSLAILDALEANNLNYNDILKTNIFSVSTNDIANKLNFNGNNNLNVENEIRLEQQKDFFIRTQINKKYLKNISIFAKHSDNTFSEDWEKLEESISNFNINDFNKSDSVPLNSWYNSTAKLITNNKNIVLVGFIIKKYIFDNQTGNYEFLEQFRVPHDPTTVFCDSNILYNKNYRYDLSCVYNLEIQSFIDDKYYNFFVESSIKSNFISCSENKVPPPPSDFFINWDYKIQCPILNWRFPVEPQRDIKSFQIFKRLSDEQPYKLICQQNFNDYSLFINEEIPSRLQKYTSNLFYKDTNFNLDKEAIYSLACVDAHGNFSNLSKQIKVFYNKFTKKLETKVISSEGAPKFYPNLFLKDEFLLESINTDIINELTIYLDTDTINVVKLNSNNNEITIATLEGNYKVNILDLELNQSLNLNLNVNKKGE